jgi:hypothetical protein
MARLARVSPGTCNEPLQLGVADKVIQAILRHSHVSTTMNIYVKSVSEDSAAAMKLLEAATLLCTNCAPEAAPSAAGVIN